MGAGEEGPKGIARLLSPNDARVHDDAASCSTTPAASFASFVRQVRSQAHRGFPLTPASGEFQEGSKYCDSCRKWIIIFFLTIFLVKIHLPFFIDQ